MFIYSSVIYTEQNTNLFNPDIAVALGNGIAGTSIIGINGTSASVNTFAAITYDFVDNNVSNIDSIPNKGRHSNFTAQQYGPDSSSDNLTEENLGENITIEDYVDDNSSNVDSSGNRGTHSNFTAQKNGPNGIMDTLSEGLSTIGSEWLDCNSFDLTYTEWTTIGTTPYLISQDQPSNYVYEPSTGGDAIGWFDFPDTTLTGTLNVNISIYCNNDDGLSNDWADVMIDYEGSGSGTDMGDIGQHISWSYDTIDLGTHTVAEVNNLRVSFIYEKSGGGDDVRIDHIRIGLSQVENYELDLEVQWTSVDFDEVNEEMAIFVNKGDNTQSLDAAGGYMVVGDGTPDWGSAVGTISFWIKWDTVGMGAVQPRTWGQHFNMETRMVNDELFVSWGTLGSNVSSTNFLDEKWYFIAIVWNENTDDLYLYVGDEDNLPAEDTHNSGWTGAVSTVGVIENNFMASSGGTSPSDGHGDDLRYWVNDRTLEEIQSDYNIELSGSETNLRSYFKLNNNFDDIGPNNNDGSGAGSYLFSSDVIFEAPPSESIKVDAWDGSVWQNLSTDLNSGWNNLTVSSYLTSSNFTIRFKGSDETGDVIQDIWNIDAALLHVWTEGGEENYELDLEVQWTNVDYNEANVELCLFGGTLGSENIRVDAWNGSGWDNLFSDLNPGWNNVTVTSFFALSTFTIRFKGGAETGDTAQDSWNLDAALLNVWTSNYDYILNATSQKTYDQNITLTLYDYSNIDRLNNCTIWFHDGAQSVQIRIANGVVTQSSGANYALPASSSRYIAAYVQQSSPGTSTLSIRLEAKTQNSIIYACIIELWVT